MSHKGRCPWDSVDLKKRAHTTKGASETVLKHGKVPVMSEMSVLQMLGANHISGFHFVYERNELRWDENSKNELDFWTGLQESRTSIN